jgi:hypothetical protein
MGLGFLGLSTGHYKSAGVVAHFNAFEMLVFKGVYPLLALRIIRAAVVRSINAPLSRDRLRKIAQGIFVKFRCPTSGGQSVFHLRTFPY